MRRYRNTSFESQAILIKRIKQKKGGGSGNTTVFFIFYFTKIYPILCRKQGENSEIDITAYVCALD